jgi:hypothetical protein
MQPRQSLAPRNGLKTIKRVMEEVVDKSKNNNNSNTNINQPFINNTNTPELSLFHQQQPKHPPPLQQNQPLTATTTTTTTTTTSTNTNNPKSTTNYDIKQYYQQQREYQLLHSKITNLFTTTKEKLPKTNPNNDQNSTLIHQQLSKRRTNSIKRSRLQNDSNNENRYGMLSKSTSRLSQRHQQLLQPTTTNANSKPQQQRRQSVTQFFTQHPQTKHQQQQLKDGKYSNLTPQLTPNNKSSFHPNCSTTFVPHGSCTWSVPKRCRREIYSNLSRSERFFSFSVGILWTHSPK